MSSSFRQFRSAPRMHLIFWLTGILIISVNWGGFYIASQETIESYQRSAKQHAESVEILSLYEKLDREDWSFADTDQLESLKNTAESLRLLEKSNRAVEIERKIDLYQRQGRTHQPSFVQELITVGKAEAAQRVRRQADGFLKISKFWVLKFWIVLICGAILLWLLTSLLILLFVKPLLHLTKIIEKISDGEVASGLEKALSLKKLHYFFIPREILQLWERIKVLVGGVARARDKDFRKLQIEKQRADSIAGALSDGVFCLESSEIFYMNPSGKKMIQSDPSLKEKIIEVLRTGDSVSVEVAFSESFQSGSFVLRRAEKGTIHDDTQTIDGIVIAQDVTRIRDSQKAKSHFLGLLSHEVRTPVTSLVMAIRLLEKDQKELRNPMHQKLVETCARDVERLRELLDDLLSISRFESISNSGPMSLVVRNADLKRILRNSEESFRAEARARGIRLEGQVTETMEHEGDWSCEIDSSKMGWALSNLVTNAIRHTPRGGEVRISLRRSRSSDGRRFFEYRVQDSGPGIAPDRMGRILEPFSGEYDLRVARTELTGSSLSIARQIAESHGGSLRVCSAPGLGSEFQLRFPSKERGQNGKVASG